MNYLSRSWNLLKLRDKVRVIWQFFAGCSETFPMLSRHLDKSAKIVLSDSRTGGLVLGEVRLFAVAEGCFSVGELAVVGVESLRASTYQREY